MVEQQDAVTQLGADYYIVKGPMEDMDRCFKEVMAELENGSFSSAGGIIEPHHVFPNQVTTEILESLAVQKAVVENLGVAVLVLDEESRILQLNREARGMLGARSDRLLSRRLPSLFSGQGAAHITGVLTRLSEGHPFEVMRVRGGGKVVKDTFFIPGPRWRQARLCRSHGT